MSLIKFHIFGIILSLNFSTFTQNSQNFSNFSRQFEYIEFDTLQIYPSAFYTINNKGGSQLITISGEQISQEVIVDLKLDSIIGSTNLKAINKFNFDSNGNMIGFIIGMQDNHPYDCSIGLLVYSMINQETLFYISAASYIHMELTMESTKNTWIYDSNEDGFKDIIYRIDLIDYELPDEYSENISGTTTGELRFNPETNDFDSYYLGSNAMKVLRLKK